MCDMITEMAIKSKRNYFFVDLNTCHKMAYIIKPSKFFAYTEKCFSQKWIEPSMDIRAGG